MHVAETNIAQYNVCSLLGLWFFCVCANVFSGSCVMKTSSFQVTAGFHQYKRTSVQKDPFSISQFSNMSRFVEQVRQIDQKTFLCKR